MKSTLNELHLFAGGGGGILGGILLGHHPVCAVEIKPYCREVLLQRQRDNALPWFPIWDDVQTFDGRPWAGQVDIICGGFPCQDISCAGRGAGIEGERSGMWGEMARIVCEVGPLYVFVENSPMLTLRGMGRLLGDLAGMGYHAAWGVLGGEAVGASQQRGRIWILACNDLQRLASGRKYQTTPQAGRNGNHHRGGSLGNGRRIATPGTNGSVGPRTRGSDWWADESGVGRVADGMADWLDRQDATGNGQIPAVAATAWRHLHEKLTMTTDALVNPPRDTGVMKRMADDTDPAKCADPNCLDGVTWITDLNGQPEKTACGCVPLASESQREAAESADEKPGGQAENAEVSRGDGSASQLPQKS